VRIVGICGSLQAASSNLSLLQLVVDVLPDGVDYTIYDGVRDLPLFNPDIEADGPPPAAVVKWRAALAAADALLIASPEYGHSLPGSLKNAIDWVIGSAELDSKIVGVTASVAHESRGGRGLDALLRTLTAVNARVVGGAAIARGPDERDRVRELVEAITTAVATAHIVDP
jgi:chromate reductase, NAD(P)H dehydrogenase (quinone)